MDDRIELVVTLENGQLKVAAKESEQAITGLGAGAGKAKPGIDTLGGSITGLSTIVKGFVGLQIIQTLLGIGKAALTGAGELEKNRIAFETMLGSASKADILLRGIQKFAAETPFEQPGLIAAAKQLIAFGISEDQVIDKMKNLGNAAMGNQEIFERVALAYGKTAGKGKATMEELNMFTEAGVPIIQALADKYKVTTGVMMKMVENGKIGFKDVDQALANLTTGTGKFAGMMEKQSHTLLGLFSTLKDEANMTLIVFGEGMSPALKDIAEQMVLVSGKTTIFKDVMGVLGQVAGMVLKTIVYMAGGIVTPIVAAYNAVNSLLDRFRAVSNVMDVINEKTKTAASDYITKGVSEGLKPEKKKGISDSSGGGGPSGEGTGKAWREYIESAGKLQGAWGSVIEETKKYKQALSDIANDTTISFSEKLAATAKATKAHFESMVRTIAAAVGEAVSNVANKTTSMLSAVNDMMAQQSSTRIANIDAVKQNMDNLMIWQYNREIEMAGLQEQTQSQKYAAEISQLQKQIKRTTNIQRRHELQELLHKKQDEKKKADIDEEALKRKQQTDLLFEVYKRQVMIKEFNRQKQYQIAIASINMAAGIIGAFAMGIAQLGPIAGAIVGAIEAAAIAALGGVQISMIQAQQPPMMETGGVIAGTPWGTTITAGEKGKPEAILPLDDPDAKEKLKDIFGGGNNGPVYDFRGAHIYDQRGFAKVLKDVTQANNLKFAR